MGFLFGVGSSDNYNDLKELVWSVPGIKCEGCAGKVESLLSGFEGVSSVSVKVEEKKVVLGIDPRKVKESLLKDLLGRAGFPVV